MINTKMMVMMMMMINGSQLDLNLGEENATFKSFFIFFMGRSALDPNNGMDK